MAVIGLDLGGTKLSGAIFNENGTILFKNSSPLNRKAGSEVGELIINLLNELLSVSDEKGIVIKSVGVCIPGIYWAKTGSVWAPNIKGWENYPLFEELTTHLTGKNISVCIDSDRACYVLGEVWQGSAKECKDVIFMAVGTGIGAGILINGEVLRGANDIAGAIGWLALERPYKEKFVQCGCYEYYASGDGLARSAEEIIQSSQEYYGELKSLSSITSYDVFTAFKNGDEIAAKVISQGIELWGMAAANLVSLFNPEKIVFGGGVFGPASEFIEEIYKEAKKWAQPISITKVKFEKSQLGSDAGLIGAGYLALKKIIK
jgi:glucokinase